MLASFPASMVNQKSTDLGIPNRFKLKSSRFSPNVAAAASSTGIPGLARVAVISAPSTDPAAIIEVSKPYWLAPA
jgi:hypothetical protein